MTKQTVQNKNKIQDKNMAMQEAQQNARVAEARVAKQKKQIAIHKKENKELLKQKIELQL